MSTTIRPNDPDEELTRLLTSIPIAQHKPDFWTSLLAECSLHNDTMIADPSDTTTITPSDTITTDPDDTITINQNGAEITQPMSLGDFQVHCDLVDTRKVVPIERNKPSKLVPYGLAAASILAIVGVASAFLLLREPITQDLESQRRIEVDERQQSAAAPATNEPPNDALNVTPAPAELAAATTCYVYSSQDGTQARVTIEDNIDQVLVIEEQLLGPDNSPNDVFYLTGTGTFVSSTQLSLTVDISVRTQSTMITESQTWTASSDTVTTETPGRLYKRTEC